MLIFQGVDIRRLTDKIKPSQESCDSRLARPYRILLHILPSRRWCTWQNLMKGGTGDVKSYHNVQSADCPGNDQHQKSRQFTELDGTELIGWVSRWRTTLFLTQLYENYTLQASRKSGFHCEYAEKTEELHLCLAILPIICNYQ